MTPNEKQIKDWKAQYGDVWEFPVDDKKAYLRDPKMTDFKRAFTAMQNEGDIAFGEEMLTSLWIGGDTDIKTNDEYFLPARKSLIKFFNYDDAETTTLEGRQTEIKIGEARCVVRVITREDLRIAEKKNPSNKPFVTQEKLFEMVCVEKDAFFDDKNNAAIRFPLYQAMERLQNQKVAILKKL
ncbi:hypothetical protein R1T16_17490 [Flavobacterium sp. DG1-102-2]|uniref:hypothetical protein n=1 Tax=Flavobacterium sp. DG1-102-2 TaxID=3081663 RepID=UPI00294A6E14|nr:hypothetical protein [Flavobacterium sp. DG1-102-2]MDV6170234.1 hypothetical protein [Flavobacterium sp. DG1-102-2]